MILCVSTALRNEIRVNELTCESARALGYSFHRKSKSVRITGYSGVSAEIILPSRIGGLPVNEIGRRAFANSDIESVEIPERAFYKCEKLRTAALPTTLRSIGREAFFACTGFSYISLPRSLRSLGEKCFSESDLRGFAADFYANFPHDRTAFKDTPLHRNFKLVLTKWCSDRLNVLLVGKNARIIFPNTPFVLNKNSACDICALDFSQCSSVKMHNSFAPTDQIYNYIYHIVLPYGTRGIALPGYVGAEYPDGKCYKVTELLDKSEDSRTERVTVRYLPKRSVHICGANFKLHMSNAAIGQHALYCIFSVGRLELIGKFKVCGEIFCFELCNYCYPAEVCWTVGNEKRVQYLPSRYLVGNYVYSGLLKAFCDNGSHGLFRHEIIDNIFRSGADEFDIHGNVVGHRRLKQREKILIALDVLRSSPELYDNDTSLYSTYIRNRRRYAEKVCENVKREYPEYMEIFGNFFAGK
ncbi:MAG: leucine-rich repeat domain-containing protein [Oscillospiraceae bacterium]